MCIPAYGCGHPPFHSLMCVHPPFFFSHREAISELYSAGARKFLVFASLSVGVRSPPSRYQQVLPMTAGCSTFQDPSRKWNIAPSGPSRKSTEGPLGPYPANQTRAPLGPSRKRTKAPLGPSRKTIGGPFRALPGDQRVPSGLLGAMFISCVSAADSQASASFSFPSWFQDP